MSRTVLVCVFVNLIDCGARRMIVFTQKILTHLIGMHGYLLTYGMGWDGMEWNGITDDLMELLHCQIYSHNTPVGDRGHIYILITGSVYLFVGRFFFLICFEELVHLYGLGWVRPANSYSTLLREAQ